MNVKKLATICLLLFVGASLAVLVWRETRSAGSAADAESEPRAPAPARSKVIAYYFHGNARCATCRKIEAFAHETITANFADALANASLVWRTVNVDEPANAHFVQDYALTTRSIVLAREGSDQQPAWTKLTRIWELVSDKPAFQDYIATETRKFMAPAP